MWHTALWSCTHIPNIIDLSGKTKKIWSASLRSGSRRKNQTKTICLRRGDIISYYNLTALYNLSIHYFVQISNNSWGFSCVYNFYSIHNKITYQLLTEKGFKRKSIFHHLVKEKIYLYEPILMLNHLLFCKLKAFFFHSDRT